MSFLKKVGVILGTIVAIVVLIVLGIIGWLLYQAMGWIAMGLIVAVLIWYVFVGDRPKKNTLPE